MADYIYNVEPVPADFWQTVTQYKANGTFNRTIKNMLELPRAGKMVLTGYQSTMPSFAGVSGVDSIKVNMTYGKTLANGSFVSSRVNPLNTGVGACFCGIYDYDKTPNYFYPLKSSFTFSYVFYNKQNPYVYNTPVVMYVELVPASELARTGQYWRVSAAPPGGGVFAMQTAVMYLCVDKNTIYTQDDFNLMDDLYVIKQITFYDNTGTIPRSISTSINSNFDVYIPYTLSNIVATGSAGLQSATQIYNGGYNYYLSLSSLLVAPTGTTKRVIPEVLNSISFAYYAQEDYPHSGAYVTVGEATTEQGEQYYDRLPSDAFILRTKSQIIDILNAFGVPFSFNLSDILYTPDVTDFPDYKQPGQPDNIIGGGDGIGDNSSDDMPTVQPSFFPYDSMSSCYLSTRQNINSLTQFLWTDDFYSNFIKLMDNPIDAIISCVYFPFSLTALDPDGYTAEEPYQIGNVAVPENQGFDNARGFPILPTYDTRIVTPGYYIEPYFGTYQDYEPYTRYSIYLPYIGIKDIPAQYLVGKTIHTEYIFNLQTGDCTAVLYSDNQLITSFDGQLGIPVQFSSRNTLPQTIQAVQGGLSLVSSIGGLVSNIAAGNVSGALSSATQGASSVINAIPTESTITKNCTITGTAGLYMPQDIFLIINRTDFAEPANLATTDGYAASYSGTVSQFTGFLKCSAVYGGTSGTEEENAEIKRLLLQGVYIS